MGAVSSEFFNVQPVTRALEMLFEVWRVQPQSVMVSTYDAPGRVLAVAPRSPIDLPTFTRSTMDGYAVHASDTFGASPSLPASPAEPPGTGEARLRRQPQVGGQVPGAATEEVQAHFLSFHGGGAGF